MRKLPGELRSDIEGMLGIKEKQAAHLRFISSRVKLKSMNASICLIGADYRILKQTEKKSN